VGTAAYKGTKKWTLRIKEIGILITEVDSQRTQDELQENMKFVAPASIDEVLVAAAKLGASLSCEAYWPSISANRIFRNLREDCGQIAFHAAATSVDDKSPTHSPNPIGARW
jgi:hypothetical protein